MPRRILVVDDEPAIRDLVAEVLAEEGYEVERAENGAAALRTLTGSGAFDLVILDMWMPVMDGRQLATVLGDRGIRVGILVMTAASEARARALEIGAVGFIGKPFSLDQLVGAVRRAVPPGDGERGSGNAQQGTNAHGSFGFAGL